MLDYDKGRSVKVSNVGEQHPSLLHGRDRGDEHERADVDESVAGRAFFRVHQVSVYIPFVPETDDERGSLRSRRREGWGQ